MGNVSVGHKLLSYINSESHGMNGVSVSNVNIDLYYDYVAKTIVSGEAAPKTSPTAAVLTNNQVGELCSVCSIGSPKRSKY